MNDLISRKALVEQIKYRMASRIRAEEFSPGFARALLDIMDAPAVAAEPVRHGRWIEKHSVYSIGSMMYEEDWLVCSVCGRKEGELKDRDESRETLKYCTSCGTRMDGEEDSE